MRGTAAAIEKSLLTRRAIIEAIADAMAAGAQHWQDNLRPRHFQVEAFKRYGYMKRQGQDRSPFARGAQQTYHYRKLRKLGHYRPLVYTGETEAASRAGVVSGAVRHTTGVGMVSMAMPDHFFKARKRRDGSYIDKPAELSAVTQAEEREIEAVVQRKLVANLDRLVTP